MGNFEFMLRKISVQDRWRLLLAFLLFLIPSQIFRILFAFVFFARKLPREIFVNDFLVNSSVLVVSGALSTVLLKQSRMEISKFLQIILTFPYIYGLEVLCAKYLKSNFLIPFIAFIIDISFWGTDWIYIRALSERSIFGAAISVSVFLTAFFLYSLEDFGREKYDRSKGSVQEL